MYYYSGTFADVIVTFCFQYPDTAHWYGDGLSVIGPDEDAVVIPQKDVTDWMERWNGADRAYAEYVMSCSYACDRLMEHQRIIFHGAAVLWNGKAYIFSAPSGTGKTTQIRLWISLFPGEVEILNGDKPILEFRPSGDVLTHPSPWKGKEGYGRDDITAPLGGIILLRQASENSIRRIAPAEAARNLFGRIYSTFNTEKDVLNAASIMDGILSSVPVWLLQNRGDEGSVRMTRQVLQDRRNDEWDTD